MKVCLKLSDGREITLEGVQNISVLEEDFQSDYPKKQEKEISEVTSEKEEGFRVNPFAISMNLFKEARLDSSQEETRKLILEAFEELKKNSRYAKSFKVIIPDKRWESKTTGELKELASEIGSHHQDWVELAFEWAQRIANGESWEDICNEADKSMWYRTVIWKNGFVRIIGGATKNGKENPASHIDFFDFHDDQTLYSSVPSVVIYN